MRRRRPARRRYDSILTAYNTLLSEQVDQEQIKRVTKDIKLNHAGRIFEACLRSLSAEALLAMTAVWFRYEGYDKVIADLQTLIDERPRRTRRVKS